MESVGRKYPGKHCKRSLSYFVLSYLYMHGYIHLERDCQYRLLHLSHGLIVFTLLEDRIFSINMVGAYYSE